MDNRRVCAYLIDLLVLTPVLVVLVATLGLRDSVQMLCGAIVLTYFFVLEARSGQTIGKRAMKLRVMHVDGGPASATAIAGRTLLRIIDSHIGMFVVLLTGHRRQRIGDIAASTVVRLARASSARPLTNGPSSGSAAGASTSSGWPKPCIDASGATTS